MTIKDLLKVDYEEEEEDDVLTDPERFILNPLVTPAEEDDLFYSDEPMMSAKFRYRPQNLTPILECSVRSSLADTEATHRTGDSFSISIVWEGSTTSLPISAKSNDVGIGAVSSLPPLPQGDATTVVPMTISSAPRSPTAPMGSAGSQASSLSEFLRLEEATSVGSHCGSVDSESNLFEGQRDIYLRDSFTNDDCDEQTTDSVVPSSIFLTDSLSVSSMMDLPKPG